jgi:hypothetical protein
MKTKLLRRLSYHTGLTGVRQYGLKEGPITEILTVADKKQERRHVGGHPNRVIERILHKGVTQNIKVVELSGSMGVLRIEDETVFNSLDLRDQVRATFSMGFDADYDYIPPNFDEKQEVKRYHDHYWDTVSFLEKIAGQKSVPIDLTELHKQYHSRDTFDIQSYYT